MRHTLKFGAYIMGFLVWSEYWVMASRLTGLRQRWTARLHGPTRSRLSGAGRPAAHG